MLRQIMIPLDGSAFAEKALAFALPVARRSGARLDLVLVRALLPFESSAVAEEYINTVAASIEADLPGRVDQHVLKDELGPIENPMSLNAIATVLARHAIEQDVDLIVMATHARGVLRRAWVGSAADWLMRIAPRPVLLVQEEEEEEGEEEEGAAGEWRGLKHILIPLDGSELAEQAIQYALELGDVFDTEYTLVRVIPPLQFRMGVEWNTADLSSPIPAISHHSAAKYLEDISANMRRAGLRVTTHIIEASAADTAIVNYAKGAGTDLIALSTAGAGGVRRLLLGSVADRVVRKGGVPVLVCNVRNFGQPLAETNNGRTAEPIRS